MAKARLLDWGNWWYPCSSTDTKWLYKPSCDQFLVRIIMYRQTAIREAKFCEENRLFVQADDAQPNFSLLSDVWSGSCAPSPDCRAFLGSKGAFNSVEWTRLLCARHFANLPHALHWRNHGHLMVWGGLLNSLISTSSFLKQCLILSFLINFKIMKSPLGGRQLVKVYAT